MAEWVSDKHGLRVEVTDLDSELGESWTSMKPEIDLCDPDLNLADRVTADVVISQALLEHVVDPVQAIRALAAILPASGILVIQTCNPFISLHRYPIDCLRFFPDFFLNLERYLPVTCEKVHEVHGSIYAVLRKT